MTGLTPGWFYERSGSMLGKDVDLRPRIGRWVGGSLCQTDGGAWEMRRTQVLSKGQTKRPIVICGKRSAICAQEQNIS